MLGLSQGLKLSMKRGYGFHGSFVGWEFEKKDRAGKIETHNEKGGGAAVADAVALVERTGRSEGVQSSQVVQTAPKGPPVIYQPVGAPVVYAAGGQQCAQAAGMSQQSMCAGIPPTGMASQHGAMVADPRMVTGVMAAEGVNPWSAAKRV